MTEVVSLPIFGGVEVHVPDLFVIKMKKGYKLISPVTKTGALTSRKGEKAFKIIKNEKNELFLHEHPHPQIHMKDFNKKDQNTMQKYFPQQQQQPQQPQPQRAYIAEPQSPVSTVITHDSFDEDHDYQLPSGKIKRNFRKSGVEERADEKRERAVMASHDIPRIERLARIAAKKVNGSGLETHHHHIHFI